MPQERKPGYFDNWEIPGDSDGILDDSDWVPGDSDRNTIGF